MANHGPGGFYANAGFVDYPPGYMYILWVIGVLGQGIASVGGGDATQAAESLLKIPPIIADLAIGWVLYRLVSGWARPSRRAAALGLAAAALYLFNPITFYDSALWGQTDAVGSLVLLLGVAALIRGNSEGAAALAVVGALIKPQFGIVLIPLVAIVVLRRHTRQSVFDPRPPVGAAAARRSRIARLGSWPGRLRGWLAGEQGPVRIVTSFVVAWIVFFVLALPFGMGPYEYLHLVGSSATGYPYVTVNAFNPWALVGAAGTPSLAESGLWASDTTPFLGPVPAVVVGSGLLVIGFVIGLARVFWRDDRRSIVLTAMFLAMCFFILPTRVHERYLFPVFVFLPILAAGSRRWGLALIVLAAGSLMNFHAILTHTNPVYATANIADLPFGDVLRSLPFVVLSVALQTAGFVYVAWKLRPATAGEAEVGLGAPSVPDVQVAPGWVQRGTATYARPVGGPPWPEPGGEFGVTSAGSLATTVIAGSASAVEPWEPSPPPPEAQEPGEWEPVRVPGLLEWIGAHLNGMPLRRDRSGELAGEPTGRWDRMDLLIVTVLVIGSFVLRAWNLSQPYDMYFDEVYHARTATEFLQDWRYGIPHSIYEYTHPHLAKYAMALSIDAFADNRVTGTTDLSAGVEDAAIEVAWSPDGSAHDGDRLYIAEGSDGVGVYDLATRGLVTTADDRPVIDAPADAVAVDPDSHRLFIATAQGAISSLDTTQLDALRTNPASPISAPQPLAQLNDLDGSIVRLASVDGSVVALTDLGEVVSVDAATGSVNGKVTLDQAKAVEGLPDTEQVVADPSAITNPSAEADVLAKDLTKDAATILPLLRSTQQVSVAGYLSADEVNSVQGHITDGTLPGVTLESRPALAVAYADGVAVLDSVDLSQLDLVPLDHPATGLALVASGLDEPTIYAASGSELDYLPVTSSGVSQGVPVPMPGAVTGVLWNQPANLIHALGTAPDGSPTIYVVEPHGNAVFADAKLPFEPVAMVMDTQPDSPTDDRMQLIALSADGVAATVDVGQNAFAWRLPGVIMGTLTLACLYLLARLLFRRRSIGLITAVLVLAGGMFFANSRIAMNDSYVTGFIVAAVTLFAPLYLGIWRRRWQVALGLLGVGLLLGLALASKWVGAYAIGGLGLLMLLRSALGRILALLAMIGLTAVLGALAIRPPDVPDPNRDWLFLGLMIVLTVLLAVAMVRRPVRFTMDELRFSVIAPAVVGALLVVVGFASAGSLPATGTITANRVTLAGAVLLALGAAAYIVAWIAGRIGLGPLAAPRVVEPDRPRASPAPAGWLRPGASGGIPWLYALACLSIVPLVIYVASYIPWALNSGGQAGSPILFPAGTPIIGLWPPGHTGQTFLDLQVAMYDYHNNLRATHPAASPWWAWPLDLKPVWFYQHGFGDGTTGVVYDSGNLVVFWLGLPAMIWAGWAAWRRRSLSLTLIVLLFAAMWLPWARIDRATFQYHAFSNLPFVVLALAYLVAELWHGPPRVVWAWTKVAAAIAILGPPLLWVIRQPLCTVAGTASVNPQGIACGAITRTTTFSEAALVSVLVILAGFIVLGWQLWLASRSGGRVERLQLGSGRRLAVSSQAAMLGTLAVTLFAIGVTNLAFSNAPAYTLSVQADEIAVFGLVLLAVPAWLVLRARDSRQFAVGIMTAAVLWFVAWYPNLAGMPLPNSIANIYQGLLPTWNYDFQFTVNLDPPVTGGLTDLSTWVVAAITSVLVAGAMVLAYRWRGRMVEERDEVVSEPA